MRKRIADLILSGSNLNYRKWLAEEAGGLVSRFDDLENISSMAILPLAKIAADGGTTASRLAIACGVEPAEIKDYLESLCEFGFAEETNNVFNVTPVGEKAFSAVGRNIIIRERLELKGRLEELEKVFNRLNSVVDI